MTGLFVDSSNIADLARTQSLFEGDHQDYVRWCDFPGEKLISNTEFVINGNPMDSYDHHTHSMCRDMFLTADKKESYFKCVGQQLPKKCIRSAQNGRQEEVMYTDGLQTPKLTHV